MNSINQENSARVRETAEPYQPRVRHQDADHGGVAESPTTPRNVESDEDDIAEMFMDSDDEEDDNGTPIPVPDNGIPVPVPNESDEVRESLVTG